MHDLKKCKCGGTFKVLGEWKGQIIYMCEKCLMQRYVPKKE